MLQQRVASVNADGRAAPRGPQPVGWQPPPQVHRLRSDAMPAPRAAAPPSRRRALQGAGNARMQLAVVVAKQAVIGGVAQQCVAERQPAVPDRTVISAITPSTARTLQRLLELRRAHAGHGGETSQRATADHRGDLRDFLGTGTVEARHQRFAQGGRNLAAADSSTRGRPSTASSDATARRATSSTNSGTPSVLRATMRPRFGGIAGRGTGSGPCRRHPRRSGEPSATSRSAAAIHGASDPSRAVTDHQARRARDPLTKRSSSSREVGSSQCRSSTTRQRAVDRRAANS